MVHNKLPVLSLSFQSPAAGLHNQSEWRQISERAYTLEKLHVPSACWQCRPLLLASHKRLWLFRRTRECVNTSGGRFKAVNGLFLGY